MICHQLIIIKHRSDRYSARSMIFRRISPATLCFLLNSARLAMCADDLKSITSPKPLPANFGGTSCRVSVSRFLEMIARSWLVPQHDEQTPAQDDALGWIFWNVIFDLSSVPIYPQSRFPALSYPIDRPVSLIFPIRLILPLTDSSHLHYVHFAFKGPIESNDPFPVVTSRLTLFNYLRYTTWPINVSHRYLFSPLFHSCMIISYGISCPYICFCLFSCLLNYANSL